ncbi:MAG TPA: hypothetical protein VEB21_12920, partial [Terriglobales bacterium]|nr:hypothetical protein [Terriglobales bacterium]
MPPQQPRITSPIEAAQGVAATDVHLEASPFADSDGDRAREAEWEIWDIKTDSRAWRATANGVELSHVHLSNGRFEGPLAAIRNLDFDRPYRARVRYRDDSGDPATEWSAWAEWRNFRTAPFGIPPLLAGAAAAEPEVEWTDTTGAAIEPPAGLTVVLRQAPCAECEGFTDLLEWDGFTADVAALAEPADGALQIVLRNAGSERLELPASNLALTLWSEAGEQRSTLYLPALSIVAGGESRLWLARNGATFFALLSETSANFQRPARETEQAWVTLPGFTVEEVGAGLRFPTQVIASGCSARSPSAPAAAHQRRSESGRYSEGQLAPACDAELLVMELKGRIWAIDSRGAKRIYADNLLDFSS